MSTDQTHRTSEQDRDRTVDGETVQVQPETRVPDGEEPSVCPYCDRPFRRAQLRDLHLGTAHEADLSDEEQEAYEAARDDEGDDLFVFHLLIIGGIVALYAMLIILYMVVLGYQG